MTGHRILYGAALICCGMFYVANGEWISGILLAAVLGVPWLSLVLSLPGMITFRLSIGGETVLPMGKEGDVWLIGSSRFPMPPFRGTLWLKHQVSGERQCYEPGSGLPTDHCGGYLVTVEGARVCDYLGIFSFPIKHKEDKTILIRPNALVVKDLPDLKRYLAGGWRPKPGGGFGENYELRLYRPGDSMNQVHWKLSAKTGRLTIRETLEPRRGLVLLTMTLRGAPEELDRKFGRLKWVGGILLRQGLPFELRVLTEGGIQSLPIAGEQALNQAIDKLLCTPAVKDGSIRDRAVPASWQYHIGGDGDES